MTDAAARPPSAVTEPLVEVVTDTPDWTAAVPELAELAESTVRLALEAGGQDPERWQVALLACSAERIRELNARFRDKDAPTDVLSFPAFATLPEAPEPRTPLGDIAIALEPARADAAMQSTPLKDHVTHLILHGCLHLLGFDHNTEEEACIMEGMESRALARLGISDPYAEGVAADPRPKE
ncbi:MAG: rRNA maturation RNase YbeY [Pikeienuella sp.]